MALLRTPRIRTLAAAIAVLTVVLVAASSRAEAAPVGPSSSFAVVGDSHQWVPLTISVQGRGVVTDSPAKWLQCPGFACSTDWWKGEPVTLVASPSAGARFVTWKDACATAKAGSTCRLEMTKARSVTAVFENEQVVTLTVTRTGDGTGTVTSSPAGINCGTACATNVNPGQEITLTAQPGNQSAFGGWGGACSGAAVICRVTLKQSGTVTARFTPLAPPKYRLTVTRDGAGTVTSTPAGINCGKDCSQEFTAGTDVVLAATPGDRLTFARWEGDCTGTQAQCTVKIERARSVTAIFVPIPVDWETLTVTRRGSGQGRVASLTPDTAINCGSDCTQNYAKGPKVTLQATSAKGSTFHQWGGACTGVQDTCLVTMDDARKVTATFVPIPAPDRRLRVMKAGTGTGTVVSVLPDTAINCGTDCSDQYVRGTTVTLTVKPGARSAFTAWGGACSGGADQPTCTVTMDGARDVTATFTALPPASWLLSVARDGTGMGTVTSNPAGIDCGSTCTKQYEDGTTVDLVATADDVSAFSGWTGGCAGPSSTCTVTMDQARQATATFTLLPPTAELLTVIRLGSGQGGVVSKAPNEGINCGTDCAQNFDQGRVVTLQATAAGTSDFIGWGGACDGQQPTCTVTMDEARKVSASFAPIPTEGRLLLVTMQGVGSGGVTSDVGGINCGLTCAEVYKVGTTVTLSAVPADSAYFTGWTGACAGTQPTCTVVMSDDRQVGATFEPLPPGSPYLTVARNGNGTGTVSSSPLGINCGSDCTQGYPAGTSVTLTATPSGATAFAGWSGGCTGTGPRCAVALGGDTAVAATFVMEVAVRTVGSRTLPSTASVNSTVYVAGPGKITQQAVTGSGKKTVTWCRASRATKATGTTGVSCNLGAKGRTTLKSRSLTLSLRTTFTPKGGRAYSVTRSLVVKKRK